MHNSEAGVKGEWTYNDNNELLSFATTDYTYDANGNATQLLLDGAVMFTYHYNAQDRLVQVDDVNGSTIAEYYYDPFGRRLWKEVGGTRTYFFYADEGLIAEYDTNGAEIRAYGYRPDSTWTTDPLWLKQGGEYYFYQNDHLGTPQTLIAQNGAIVWSARYTAFGQAGIEIEVVTNNLRFPGQYFDVETGLNYNWFRYYDSRIGRYLRTDPMKLERGDLALFIYANNNPVTKIDPQGLFVIGSSGLGVSGGFLLFAGGVSWIPIIDQDGNTGYLVCWSFGIGSGAGIVGGSIPLTIWGKPKSICDLHGQGPSIALSLGGGGGLGGAIEVGESYFSSLIGVGVGGFGGAIGLWGGCHLVNYEKKCAQKKNCDDFRLPKGPLELWPDPLPKKTTDVMY